MATYAVPPFPCHMAIVGDRPVSVVNRPLRYIEGPGTADSIECNRRRRRAWHQIGRGTGDRDRAPVGVNARGNVGAIHAQRLTRERVCTLDKNDLKICRACDTAHHHLIAVHARNHPVRLNSGGTIIVQGHEPDRYGIPGSKAAQVCSRGDV